MPKRTFQPNNRRRAKTHGFRARMATKNGRAGAQAAPRQGPQAPDPVALLEKLSSATDDAPAKLSFALPKQRRLRARAEFQKVYAEGQRYDGRLMAAFLRANDAAEHRLGVTASTKAIGKSVDRVRAKRLLRELFRRSANELASLAAAIRLGHQRQAVVADFD